MVLCVHVETMAESYAAYDISTNYLPVFVL